MQMIKVYIFHFTYSPISLTCIIYPTKKKRTSKISPLSFPFNAKMPIVIKTYYCSKLSKTQVCRRRASVPSTCVNKKHQCNRLTFLSRVFNDTVHIEFRICCSIEKYENASFSLSETSNDYIHAFCFTKVHLQQ